MKKCCLVLFLILLAGTYGDVVRHDHTMDPNQELLLFPRPVNITVGKSILDIEKPCDFEFKLETSVTDKKSAAVIEEILSFYSSKIFRRALEYCERKGSYSNQTSQHKVNTLKISIENPSVRPPLPKEDESYTLNIKEGELSLKAKSYIGFLRGLESFSQLIYFDEVSHEQPWYYFPSTPLVITDAPMYPVRGITIDVTINYISKFALFNVMDGMMYSKLNTLHLILASDHSFPLQLKSIPTITYNGAFSEFERYTAKDISDLVDHAMSRGIRIIPQINAPSMTRALLLDPEYKSLMACKYEAEGKIESMIINPGQDKTYEVLGQIFEDVAEMFPDEYIHIGKMGDPNTNRCFGENVVKTFQTQNNITETMEEYFFKRLITGIKDRLPTKTFVIEARGRSPLNLNTLENFKRVAYNVAPGDASKYETVPYFINDPGQNLGDGMGDWQGDVGKPLMSWSRYGGYNPIQSGRPNFLGFCSFLQGSLVSDQTLEFYLWPRAASQAERLWRGSTYQLSTRRIGGLEVRYNERGIGCQPLGCEWCQRHYNECLGGPF